VVPPTAAPDGPALISSAATTARNYVPRSEGMTLAGQHRAPVCQPPELKQCCPVGFGTAPLSSSGMGGLFRAHEDPRDRS
jgi:hypothetical protein